MPEWLNTCFQPLDERGQAKPCPCRYSQKCPEATLDCKMGRQWCYNIFTVGNGKLQHTPAVTKAGKHIPCCTYTPFSRDCQVCMYHLKRPFYSSALGEFRPFEEEIEDLPF